MTDEVTPSVRSAMVAWASRAVAYLKRRKEIAVFLTVLLLLAALCYALSTEGPSAANRAATRIIKEVAAQATVTPPETLRATVFLELERAQEERALREFLLHLSVALVVAVIIILTVELSTRQELKREIDLYREALAKEVWSAITGRMVPVEISREIEGVLKADAVRHNVEYRLTLKRYEGLDDRFMIIRRELSYRIRNVTNAGIKHPVRAIVETEFDRMTFRENGVDVSVPRHISISFDGKAREIVNPYENIHELIDLAPGGQGVDVYVCSEEAVRVPGQNGYTYLTPGAGFRLTIVSHEVADLISDLRVHFNHPNRDEIRQRPDGTYRYDGGFLPGHGFVVQWKEKTKAGEPAPAK